MTAQEEELSIGAGVCPHCGRSNPTADWNGVSCMLFEKIPASDSHTDIPDKLTVKPILLRRYCGQFVCCDACLTDARTGRCKIVQRFSDLYGAEGGLELTVWPYHPEPKTQVSQRSGRSEARPRYETAVEVR